jgi:hypothetical protein
MENQTQDTEYEKPSIVDHGDLTDLTAMIQGGHQTDATFPCGHCMTDPVSGP